MFTLATYNVHRCIGRDGRYAPERVRRVLREVDADVVALQEVELFRHDPELLQFLCADSDWRHVHGLTMDRPSGEYGNALLSRLPLRDVLRHDISVPGREPRGAIQATLECDGFVLRVMATHLGLRPGERRLQVRQLMTTLDMTMPADSLPDISVLAGDLNEWFLWGRPVRWLHRHFRETPAPRTWPSGRPLFALDRIWVEPRETLASLRVHDSALASQASDHLPLVATLDPDRFRDS